MTLSTLLARLETATEADQAEALGMAFDVFLPRPCEPWNGNQWNDEYSQYHALRVRFCHMIEAHAYIDAALLIMREVLPGWSWTNGGPYWASNVFSATLEFGGLEFTEEAKTAPLAIIAAICAAKGDGDA